MWCAFIDRQAETAVTPCIFVVLCNFNFAGAQSDSIEVRFLDSREKPA
jgi:hypothetical protein